MERVKQGEFALLGAAQSVYSLLEKQVRPVILIPGQFTVYHVMKDASCDVIEMGPNIFNGLLVMIWQKNFPYGPIFNY